MKKNILILMLVLLLVGSVFAGVGLNNYYKQVSSELVSGDFDIKIYYSDDYILYDVYQAGVINSKNNRFAKSYCSVFNETLNECESYSDYTDNEIEDLVADKILDRLEDYYEVKLSRDNYSFYSSGNLEVVKI